MNNEEKIRKEIIEKIKNNLKYVNPMSKIFQEDIKKYGFKSGFEFVSWMQQNEILKLPKTVDVNHLSELYGDVKKYNRDHMRKYRHDNGLSVSMSDNIFCTSHIGICIGEVVAKPILTEIFGSIDKTMPYCYPGYEYVVKRGLKIDVKTANLSLSNVDGIFYDSWSFHIKCNNIADYFLLLAFDNLEDKTLLHILLVGKNEMVRKKRFNRFDHLKITNSYKGLLHFLKYDWINKLNCLKLKCE